jgi:hypothetical protein
MRMLCFNLNIDYDEFPANKSGFARELVMYMERQERLDELESAF